MANPFAGGGKVAFVPGKVKSPYETEDKIPQADEDALRAMALERDLVAADLLEGDKYLDILDAAIDDQMKDFDLPGGEAADAARRLCGSESIDWECYKKAKELLRAAPIIANGYDPVQLAFTNKITKRKGTVLYDCASFDPNTFFDAEYEDGDLGPKAKAGSSGDTPEETGEDPAAIQKRAQENQKKWAMLVLFWDLLWGKPKVRQAYKDKLDEGEENFEELQGRIAELEAQGKTDEAEALAKKLGTATLPDLVREGRPFKTYHLAWEAYPASAGPINDLTKAPNKAAAIWEDPWNIGEYKNKGIPAIESGFILSLLVGALALPSKAISKILNIRNRVTNKFKKIKRVPVVGKGLFKAWQKIVGLIFMPFVYINNVFIEICIWIALKPRGYAVDVGKVSPEYEADVPSTDVQIDDQVTAQMDVEDTPAGFLPIDCLEGAQAIVNKVHNDAVQ